MKAFVFRHWMNRATEEKISYDESRNRIFLIDLQSILPTDAARVDLDATRNDFDIFRTACAAKSKFVIVSFLKRIMPVGTISPRSIELIELEKLMPAASNARTHSKKQIAQIAVSIGRFGFTNPVLVDDDNGIIAGHGRVAAARQLGLAGVPCMRLSNMTEAEKRAYIIADNKLALNAGWDQEILAIEFQGLLDLGFDLAMTGFELPEIDIILTGADDASPEPDRPEDRHPQPTPNPVTRLGDKWVLGRHVLLCGDAKDLAAVQELMDGLKADMVFTDPPYNVAIEGNVSGLGRTHHREFVEASGEMSKLEFTEFLRSSMTAAAVECRDGAIVFLCMDWRHIGEVLAAGHTVFSELKNVCVWAKTNAGMGTFYRSKHEMVFVWKVGSAPHTNTFGLGDKGRYRTNVWSYPGVNTFKSDRMEEIGSHPTVKPVALVSDAIRDVSNRGQIVLDVFGGSGTTLIAAEKTGRRARLLELDPIYCDVIVRRWEKLTGKVATLSKTGEVFEDLKAARGAPERINAAEPAT
jgi:DNA modification methylase